MAIRFLLMVLAALLCASCAERDKVYRGVYEALTQSSAMRSDRPGKDPPFDQPMSYDLYKYERDRALNNDDK
jgi:hypothetical protein